MVNQDSDNALALHTQNIGDIRALAQHYFMPPKPSNPKDADGVDFVRKMAGATAAVELVCSLMNVFGLTAGLKNYSGLSACADLTFGLNTNVFWVQNSAYLMPLLNAAINAFADNQKLNTGLLVQESVQDGTVRPLTPQPLWRNLEYHNRYVWLEMLPAILFCLKGYGAMREKSLEMKQAFEKFLRTN